MNINNKSNLYDAFKENLQSLSESTKEYGSIIHNQVIESFSEFNKILKTNEEELVKYRSTPLEHLFKISKLLEERYKIKKCAEEIYNKYNKLVNHKYVDNNKLSTQEKIDNAALIIRERMFPAPEDVIAGEVSRVATDIYEFDTKNKTNEKKLKEVQRLNDSIFKSLQLKDFNTYFSKCTKVENDFYRLFKELYNDVRRKVNIPKSKSKKVNLVDDIKRNVKIKRKLNEDSDFYTVYNNIMVYLKDCINIQTKKKK